MTVKRASMSWLALVAAGTVLGQGAPAGAGDITVETRANVYVTNLLTTSYSQWWRQSSVSVRVFERVSVSAYHQVYDGLAFTGSLENWKVGVRLSRVFTELPLVTLQPFGGVSLNNSRAISGVVGVDAGFSAEIKIWDVVGFAVGYEGTFFKDGNVTETFLGFPISFSSDLTVHPFLGMFASGSNRGQGPGLRIRWAL